MNNRTPFGKPLQMPQPPPLRAYAMYDAGDPCLDHSVAYTGSIPCTGVLRCHLCGCCWNEDGKYLEPEPTD